MADEIKITFTGDIMSCMEIDACYKTADGYDYSELLSPSMELLHNCDYLVGNLETPVAGEEFGFTDEPYAFNTPVEFLDMLKASNFSLLATANNHCLDRGYDGLCKTIENINKLGLDYVGTYATEQAKPFVKDFGGIKVAFVNYTYGTNAFYNSCFLTESQQHAVNLFQPQETLDGSIHLLNSMEQIQAETEALYKSNPLHEKIAPIIEKLKRDIELAKAASDFVVFIMHSGGQYNYNPDAYTLHLAEMLKDFGVDIIIGHHPHIIHPCDQNGIVTAYSLGNFIFLPTDEYPHPPDQPKMNPQYSVLFHLYLNDKGLSRASFSLMKTIINSNGKTQVYPVYDLIKSEQDQTQKQNLMADFKTYAGRFANINVMLADEIIL